MLPRQKSYTALQRLGNEYEPPGTTQLGSSININVKYPSFSKQVGPSLLYNHGLVDADSSHVHRVIELHQIAKVKITS